MGGRWGVAGFEASCRLAQGRRWSTSRRGWWVWGLVLGKSTTSMRYNTSLLATSRHARWRHGCWIRVQNRVGNRHTACANEAVAHLQDPRASDLVKAHNQLDLIIWIGCGWNSHSAYRNPSRACDGQKITRPTRFPAVSDSRTQRLWLRGSGATTYTTACSCRPWPWRRRWCLHLPGAPTILVASAF